MRQLNRYIDSSGSYLEPKIRLDKDLRREVRRWEEVRLPGPMPARKVLLVPVCRDFVLNTDGTISPVYYDLEPETNLERLGPYLERIVPHVISRGPTSLHKWNMVFRFSGEGRSWSAPQDLFPLLTSATTGYAIQSQYNTTSNFGLQMRYALRAENTTAGAIQSATVSVWLALHFWS